MNTNKEWKKDFIIELVSNVQADILNQVEKMPDDWDGIELRWYISDMFKEVVFGGFEKKNNKRYRDYNSHVICNMP